MDSGAEPDTGLGADTGSAADTGPGTDTGMAFDTGVAADTGVASDTGTAGDSSVTYPDGGSGAPPWATLTLGPLGTCTDVVPCGGDIVGTWETSGGCFEDDLDSNLSRCPGAMVTRRAGRARGRVVFGADGFAVRAAESEVEYELFYPALCAGFYSCAMLEAAIAPFVDTVACPVEASGDCTCTARIRTTIMESDAYRTEANQIVSVSSGKRWDYCVTGERLDYQDTDRSSAGEPGTVELTRR